MWGKNLKNMKEKPYRHLEEHLEGGRACLKPSGGKALTYSGIQGVTRMMGAEGGKGRTGQSTWWELGGKSCGPCNHSVLVTFAVIELLFLVDVLSALSRMPTCAFWKQGFCYTELTNWTCLIQHSSLNQVNAQGILTDWCRNSHKVFKKFADVPVLVSLCGEREQSF